MKALHIEKIEKNENNTFQLKNINQQELVNNYYDDFVNKMKKDPKSAYNKLDSDYKSSRFKTFESFEKYINSYINSNRFLSEYKMTKYESYTELICYDNYGIVWIFNISGIRKMHQVLIIHKNNKGRRLHRRLCNIEKLESSSLV